jgi:hypothetical protein
MEITQHQKVLINSGPMNFVWQHFAELAIPLAQRGIPVIPVLPLSKRRSLDDQFHRATSEISQIAQWYRENPDFNAST